MARPLGDVVQLRRTPEAGGQWLTAKTQAPESVRERVGRHVAATIDGTPGLGLRVTDPYRLLTPDQLWMVYARTPDVRAAVDGIARRIATWAWTLDLEAFDGEDEADQRDEALEVVDEAERFLRAPNGNGETWQELLTKVVTDLLVYEQGVIEEVYDRLVPVTLATSPEGRPVSVKTPPPNAKLEELVALNGASIGPMADDFGRIYCYQQDLWGTLNPIASGGGRAGDPSAPAPLFSRDQIVAFSLFPNTSGRSSPLIESIVNEVITILRSSEHSMLALDADEIPPGILVLTGVAGKAAEQAKSDLQRLRGKDHKIRVITNPDPRGSGAHWVELRRTPKDLALIEVVREIRRTIWRVFGVLPVEMGDTQDMPRAVGQVQLDVSTSHLVEPILDLIEAKINARIVPLLVGEDLAGKVALRFDREAKLSPAEQLAKAQALTTCVREGILTRNEARSELDRSPVEGGDVATIAVAGGLKTVASLLEPEPAPDPTLPPGFGGGGAEDDDEPEPEPEPEDEDEAPGEIEGGEQADGAPGENSDEGLELARRPAWRVIETPSDWPSAAIFRGKRTVALAALADSVSRYTREIRPLYREAADEVVAAVASIYDGTLRPEGAARVMDETGKALDRLAARWSAASAPIYREVAKQSRDRAVDFTGIPVLADWSERGEAYGVRAMSYLTGPGGLLSDLRASVAAIVGSATGEPAGRAARPAPSGVVPGVEEAILLAAIANMFDGQEHRIENWSGRLVELASEVLSAGMAEGSADAGEWYYEWVAVGDEAMCRVCEVEGRQGFRPASALRVHPGGSTDCRARCRCVLVWWTRDEVKTGAAESLSGNAPGNRPL
jgi:hypothetical protein